MESITHDVMDILQCAYDRIITQVKDISSNIHDFLNMVKDTDKHVKITNKYPKRDIKVTKLRYYTSYKTIYHCRNNC